jgi:hypothetical protein
MRWALLLLALGGCQDNLGAVSVRWEIVDLTRGDYIKPNDVAGPDGVCEHVEPDMSPVTSWKIERVRLVLADANGELACDDKLIFGCSKREAVTPFSLPLGTYAMSLRAVYLDCSDDPNVVTPAPSVRTIASSFDMSMPDGGPVM